VSEESCTATFDLGILSYALTSSLPSGKAAAGACIVGGGREGVGAFGGGVCAEAGDASVGASIDASAAPKAIIRIFIPPK